jgi:hypothetical protein
MTPRYELKAALKLVASVKIPLLLALWFFQCATRPTEGPFAIHGPLALRSFARWEGREQLVAAASDPTRVNPFTGGPTAELLPLSTWFFRAIFFLADAIHLDREVLAVTATIVLLVPAVALVRASLRGKTEEQKNIVSLILLVGPGAWYHTAPGPGALTLLALGAALFGLHAKHSLFVAIGSLAAGLAHPVGLWLTPTGLAILGQGIKPRRLGLLMASAPLFAFGAWVLFLSMRGVGIDTVLAPLRALAWPGVGIERLAVPFGKGGGMQSALDLYAIAAGAFVATGAIACLRDDSRALQVLALGALYAIVRDWADAPSVMVWCIPAAVGWARIVKRFESATWAPALAVFSMFPILFRAHGHLWDWIALAPDRPIVAGAAAIAAQHNGALGLAAGPREKLVSRRGSMQRFDFGTVYCTPSRGCRAIDGVAARRYDEAGGWNACGLPTRDPREIDGAIVYPLERGVIRIRAGGSSEAVCAEGHSVGER